MKTHEHELTLIKDVLRRNPRGIKVSRIARELSMNRNAAAKFLEILLMTGQVDMLEHGMSKIFILSRRTGIPTMLDGSGDFILVLDREMKVARVNDNYLKFTGLKSEDVIGENPDAGNLPIIGKKPVFGKLREAYFGTDVRTGIKETFEGEDFFFDIRLTPTTFNDGTRGITAIIGDVTKEKKTEIALRESEASFRTLFGESPVGTAVFSTEGTLTNANPAFLKCFGAKNQKELAGLNLFAIPGVPAGSHGELEKGKQIAFESAIDLESGNRRDVVFRFQVKSVSLAKAGRQSGYLVQVQENAAMSRTGAGQETPAPAPDENRKLLEEILSCITDAVILVDARTSAISYMNPSAGKMFGYERAEFLGKDPRSLLGAGGTIRSYPRDPHDSLKEESFVTESRLKRKGGTEFPATFHLRPIFSDERKLKNIVIVVQDLSVRKGEPEWKIHAGTGSLQFLPASRHCSLNPF